MGHTAAALAATSLAFARVSTADARAFSAQTLTAAAELYVLAAANEGIYSENFIPNQKVRPICTAHALPSKFLLLICQFHWVFLAWLTCAYWGLSAFQLYQLSG